MDKSSAAWQPCPAGELSRLKGRLRRKRQVRQVQQVAAVIAPVMAVLFVAWMGGLFNSNANVNGNFEINHYAGISCPEVAKAAPVFAANQLNQTQRQQILDHLARCDRCREFYQKQHLLSSATRRRTLRYVKLEKHQPSCPCCQQKKPAVAKMRPHASLQTVALQRTFFPDTPLIEVEEASSDLRTTHVWHRVY